MDPKFRSLSLVLALSGVFLSHAAAAVNDHFVDRTAITGNSATVTASSVAATGEAGEPDHAGNAGAPASVWWAWTAPQTGTVLINTAGSDFDTVLGVYTGTAVNALTQVAANDNAASGQQSSVAFACTAGTEYIIAVDGAGAAEGNVSLALTAGVPEIVVEQGGVGLSDGSATVVFGTVAAPGFTDRSFTVRNTGTGPLLNVAASVTGAGYSVTVQPAAVIAAGGSSPVTVRFAPTVNGAHPGGLEVASSDADENPFNVGLSGSGLANITGFSENFDPAIHAALWASTTPGTVDTIAQAAGSGSTGNSLRFDGDAARQAVTQAVNALSGGSVAFSFASGNGSVSGWETADGGEEVVLEYSLDGTAWTQFGGPYQTVTWQRYTVSLPTVARTGATRFRWRQLSHSGSTLDNWALDDITIGPPTAVPVISSSLTARAFTGNGFFYQITANNSPDTYTASGLPVGLTVNATTGLISGTASATGTYNVTLGAVNVVGPGTATLVLTVQAPVPAEDFKILSLGTGGAVVVDHNNFTGDDRGGIAVSNSHVFVTGDNGTARYELGTLAGGAGLTQIDGLCSDLSTGALYALGLNGTPYVSGTTSVNQLLVLNPSTGLATGQVVSLSATIPVAGGMVCSGAGRIVIHNRTEVFDIQLPTGQVVARGAMATVPAYGSESWASWGVAEQFNGALWLAYRDGNSQEIRRMRVPDGLVETIATFSNLGDLASWTVSPQTGRWYMHYENSAQFGGSSETLVTALATFDIGNATSPPEITSPLTATAYIGASANYRITALRFPTGYAATGLPAGLTVDTATGLISGVPAEGTAGTYSVTISATNGAGTSTAALSLLVTPALSGFFDDFDPGLDSALWASFGGTVTADTTGQATGPGSTDNSLRFDGATPRFAMTRPIDTRTGGAVIFLLAPANGATAGWETPGSFNTMRVEYSVNSGLNWVSMGDQPWVYEWREVILPLPAAAKTGATQFRWIQYSPGTATSDNWAIDNVRIGPPTEAPVITSELSATAYDQLPFTYRIISTNLPDTFAAESLPEWLTLDTVTGILSGTPPETGSWEIPLSATNIIGTGTALLTVNVYSTLSDFYDAFDPDVDDGLWQAFGGTPVADTVGAAAGSGSVGNSLRFNGTGVRFATTNPINTTDGGMVAFNFSGGNGTATGWDTQDTGEGVMLEYSTNGVNFTQLGGPYINTAWQTVSIALPPAARAGAVQFRWRQLSHSGAFNDNWALDDVIVGQPSAPPVLTSALSRSGHTGVPLSYQITATNVPTAFSASGLPAGLAVAPVTGLISGTPAAAGSYAITLGAENAFGPAAPATLTLNIGLLVQPEDFKILTLGTSSPLVVDHNSLTSDDRGGIAVSGSRVFITGDSATASFTLSNLSGGTSTGRIIDGIFSDVATGDLYTFGYNGTAFLSGGGLINQIIPLDGATGAVAGTPIPLSQTITMQYSSAVFSGVGRVVLHNRTNVYDILLPSGLVVDRGPMSAGSWYPSENWASWGVAEFFNGNLWIAYHVGGDIVRQRVPDGLQETIATFSNLSDMASWTVSPQEGRWYLHYEGGGQFGGSSETLASAQATFNIGASTRPPAIMSTLSATAFTDKPFSYQITANRFPTLYGASGLPTGLTINTATGIISGSVAAEGTYVVTIAATNAAGTSTAPLLIRILGSLTGFSDDFDPARDPLMWAGFGGTATTDSIGRASSGSTPGNSLRFDGSGTRFALTNPVDTRSGGSVIFRFCAGNDAASTTGWDTLDNSAEHVILEYTLNGTTYTQIGGPYSNLAWLTINVPIPAAARTGATRFRWRQLSHSADNSSDNWAIDDVRIGPPAAPPVITSGSTVTAYFGIPFNWPISATNFPDSFSATGLPAWLTLNPATGVLSGTPSATGAAQIELSATNQLGTGTATLVLTVSPSLPSVALFSDPSFVDMSATGEVANMNTALQSLGYTVNAFSGITDAAWMAAFDSNSIVIVPDLEVGFASVPSAVVAVIQAQLSAGKGLIVAGSSGTNDEAFLNTVGGWVLTPGTTSNTASLVKSAAATDFPNSPSTLAPLDGTYLVSSASLPGGAHPVYTLGSETAVFHAGHIGFAAHDWFPGDDPEWRSVLGDLIRVLTPPPPPGILSASSVSHVAGAPFTYQIVASNSPDSYSALNLPLGLSLDTTTGLITGTVLSPAIYTIGISATNTVGTANGTLTLTVTAPAPEIAVVSPDGVALTDGSATVPFNGAPGGQFTRSFTIRNTGSQPLTGLAATINGTNAADFTLPVPPPGSIAPGGSGNFSITYAPGAPGSRTAALHIASNDADENPFDISLSGSAGAELPAPQPAQTGIFTGFTRGYWFTAPAAFEITGLRVPTEASSAAQSVAVVRFAATPPTYASTTTGFTLLHVTRGNASGGIIPVSINVAAGDIIGVLGDRGGIASYAPSGSTTIIRGHSVTLRRMGMQDQLASRNPSALWGENTGSISRVEMYYRNSQVTDIDVRVTGGAALSSGSPVTVPGTAAGSYSETEFTIQNTGGADLTGLTPALSGAQAGEFSIVSPPSALVPSGGTTTIVVRYSPAAATAAAQLSITSNDPDENPFTLTLNGALSAAGSGFSDWAAAGGLTGPAAQAGASPFADGVSNLVKYAFNLNPAGPDTRQLPAAGGTAGLPRLILAGTASAPVLHAEFLRRTGGGVLYTPQRSTTAAPGSWVTFTSTPAVTAVAPGWERVVYDEPIPAAGAARTFGRIEVSLQP